MEPGSRSGSTANEPGWVAKDSDDRLLLERDLREVCAAKGFDIAYQAQVDLRTERVTTFEALIRWHHPDRGDVSPAEFIPLAEQIGLIGEIGQWVLERACREAMNWPEDVGLAVNVSALQIADLTLPATVGAALSAAGLSPSRLELEVTETMVMPDDPIMLAVLHAIRDSGVRIVMDDFDIGFSTLGYLLNFPFSKIKIDRSFIDKISQAEHCHKVAITIVRSIIGLCKDLELTCLAEGVETEEQLTTLMQANCMEVQGYLLDKPQPLVDTHAALRNIPGVLHRMNMSCGNIMGDAQQLQSQEIPFLEIANAANDITLVTTSDLDPPGPIITYVNPAFTRLTRYTAAEVMRHLHVIGFSVQQIEESINILVETYRAELVRCGARTDWQRPMTDMLGYRPATLASDMKLADEAGRVAALHRYGVLDTKPEEPFHRITALVRAVFDVPISTISFIDSKRQWLKSVLGPLPQESPRELSFCTHTIRTSAPLVVPNAQADERFARNPAVTNPPHIRSYLGVPLETPDGYNIGALCAIDLVPREFTSREIEMLKSFASIVVDELELRDLARLDHLTGALSRRTFLEEAGQAIRRLKRYDRPASIVMFDIDHFKLINDKYGHPAGDAVLRAVGGACSSLARDGDSFGRLGGEEFAFLLPDTATGGFAAAERFRKMLSTLATAGYPSIRITASFGIASLTPDMTVERWIVAADTALYAAKHGGRNQSRLAV